MSRACEAGAVPIIDLAALREGRAGALARAAEELTRAAERVGFFYVTNHGVARPLLDAAVAASDSFFALPLERKRAVACSDRHRGFLEPGQATMAGARRPDLKESFIWGIEVAADDPAVRDGGLLAPNRWPDGLPALQAALVPYLEACNACGWLLMRTFATALGVPADTFLARIDRPVSRGGTIFYPPQPAATEGEQWGVAPHTDFGCLTLLWQDEVGGLEVEGKAGWVPAPPVEGCLVVNVGDLLARWTNDRFRSTPHRVVNRSGRARRSIAVFVDPNDEQEVAPICRDGEPQRYPSTTVGAYIRGRYDAAFAYRQGRKLAS